MLAAFFVSSFASHRSPLRVSGQVSGLLRQAKARLPEAHWAFISLRYIQFGLWPRVSF